MVGQNAPDFYTGFPYPFGFDYMYFVLWRYINYTADPLTSDPFAKGLAYQMAESGRNAVIVVPCNGLGPEIGVFMNAGQVQLILQDVQAYMFRRAGAFLPPFLGRTALAGFSAGNLLVTQFLNDPSNRSHSFYLDTLQELYMFEAPNALDWVNAAVAWQSAGNAGESYTLDTKAASKRLLGQFPTPRLGVLSLHTQPNSWNHFLADHAVVFNLLPLTPMTTLLRTKWLVHKDAEEGKDYDLKNLTEVWRRTNDQDATFVGWNQSGVQNPAYKPGPYSPNENQVEKFIDWYIGRLGDHIGESGSSVVHLAKPGKKQKSAVG